MIKKHKIMASVALIILICGAIYLYRMMFPRYKVADKEAATAFVLEHQTELNELVSHMKEEYERGEGKDVITMIRKEEFHADEYIKKNSWLKRYRIRSISIHKIYEQYQVCIAFIDAPSSYEYFEVYYAEDDEPLGWGDDTELVEEREGIYVQRGSYYVYETEKITDHWYYYQCRT